jgi:hypothetical protein
MSTCPATQLAWSIWVFSALFGAMALVITFLVCPLDSRPPSWEPPLAQR